jgi:hypothetical protein
MRHGFTAMMNYDDRFDFPKFELPSWSCLESGKGAKRGANGKFYLPPGSKPTAKMGVMGDDEDPNKPALEPTGVKAKGEKAPNIDDLKSLPPASVRYKFVDIVAAESASSKLSKEEIDAKARLYLNSGIMTSPIVMEEYAYERFRVIHGQDAFAVAKRAKEINPSRGEMVNAFVLPFGKTSKGEREALLAEARMADAGKKRRGKTPKVSLRDEETSVKFKLTDISAIDPPPTKKPPESKIQTRAESYLRAGVMASPVVLKEYKPEKFKVVHGVDSYWAAAKAKTINLDRAEMVNSFVIPFGASKADEQAILASVNSI